MLATRINLTLLVFILTWVIGSPATRAQVIENPEFDDSTQSWWVPGNGDLTIVNNAYKSGKACRINNRTEVWNGISQTLLGDLEVGKDYHFSCYVKTVGVPEGELELEIAQTDDRGSTYVRIGSALTNNSTWTHLQGGFKLESNGPLTGLHFTVKGSSNDPRLFSFILDSVSVTENDWKASANARIEQHRKRDVKLTLVGSDGIVQPDVIVGIDQVRHHFAFGSTLNSDVAIDPEYAEFFKQNFEWGTIEWFSQWKAVEWTRGVEDYSNADASVDFAAENGIKLRGHALAWPDANFRPTWLSELPLAEIETELEERISNVVNRYESRLVHWDVCNEILNHSYFRDVLGDPIEPWMFQQARSHDANVKLCTNEFGIVDSQYKAQRYRDMILYHQASGADVGGIGLQSHFQLSSVSPKSIEIGLGELKNLGPEIWFTEFDVSNPDPVERAKALEAFYRYAFSVPEAKGIIMWGFWAGTHWRGGDASLVDQDWTINAAGQKYFDLIQEWTTTDTGSSDVAGEVEFRGFHGSYLITTTHPTNDVKNYHLVSVPPGNGDLDVELVLDATANSLTIYGTKEDDVFEYDLEDPLKVTINDQPVVFSLPVGATVVRFEGLGGTDHLEVKTKMSDGNARISDSELTWVEDGLTVSYAEIEAVALVAQGTDSTATFFDSASDDSFESYLDVSTLTTPKASVTANDFRHVYAWSKAGGNDTAVLFDSANLDFIISNMSSTTIKRGKRIRRAIQFDQVEVFSSSGNDVAYVLLPRGAKTINASPTQSTIVFGGVTHQFTDVFRTVFRGATGNSDTVLLVGSAGQDTLRITPSSTLFSGPDFRYVFTNIPNFDTAAEPDSGGSDRLIFYDSDGDDSLNAAGDTVTISGPGYSHHLKFFDIINAYRQKGGEDTATQSSPRGSLRLVGDWQ